MDTGADRTFIMTAGSVDSELVSSDCSVALLCSYWTAVDCFPRDIHNKVKISNTAHDTNPKRSGFIRGDPVQ